ncbi:E1 ubiquitin-activating protein uba2 [Perkinsus olseni]|uniref:E1 ubiquitin-activating protein uba2 n=1 Tax=Perkinsus olseni TaxID=32597 RepID=A0A7J6MKS6_PEROL|nr:E1 ubiquitin-activating protein uba2 [Perkinsus olseni]KAF4672105.1 E1 ubiquitin-activating protein uba2 [Perkinsus olseni]
MKDSRAEGDAEGGPSQAPQVARSLGGQLGAFQSHLIKNPDVMEQMLNTPVMQTVLQNGDMLSSLVSMNRQMRELMDDNPELRRMLMDPSMMKSSAEAFQDPLAVRELISNTETAVANINATVPGGYDSLRRLYEECSSGGKECEDDRGGGEPAVPPQIREAREAAEDAEKLAEMSRPPVWAEAFDPSAMAAMMQDPNMHQLMSSVFRSAENAHKVGARSSEKSGGNNPSLKPFCEPTLLQLMFDPQTLQSMSKLEGSMEMLDGKHIPAIAEAAEAGGKMGPKLSGLSLGSPAANFAQSFSSFIEAQNENPEVLYRAQLSALKASGFYDVEKNIAALRRTDGNVNRAIDLLISHVNDPNAGLNEEADVGNR